MENEKNYRLVTCMFPDKESAERGYVVARDRGYTDRETSVLMSDDTRTRHFSDPVVKTEMSNKAIEGTGTGAIIGTTLGAALAAVAAIGTNLVLPGLGLIVAGPLAAGLAGAGAGAATGGLIGAMIGAGIKEPHAQVYEDGIKKGHIVLEVRARNDEDADYIANEWRKGNAIVVHR